jgi:hypothetical protein
LRSITVNRSMAMAGFSRTTGTVDMEQERFYSMAGLTWAKPCSRERCYVGRVKRWGGLSESVADWRLLMRTGGWEKAGVGWRWLVLAGGPVSLGDILGDDVDSTKVGDMRQKDMRTKDAGSWSLALGPLAIDNERSPLSSARCRRKYSVNLA